MSVVFRYTQTLICVKWRLYFGVISISKGYELALIVLIVLFGTNCSHQGIPPRWAIDPLGKREFPLCGSAWCSRGSGSL